MHQLPCEEDVGLQLSRLQVAYYRRFHVYRPSKLFLRQAHLLSPVSDYCVVFGINVESFVQTVFTARIGRGNLAHAGRGGHGRSSLGAVGTHLQKGSVYLDGGWRAID
jgi:hypothetical protein